LLDCAVDVVRDILHRTVSDRHVDILMNSPVEITKETLRLISEGYLVDRLHVIVGCEPPRLDIGLLERGHWIWKPYEPEIDPPVVGYRGGGH
jgi:hypothetical protein